MNEDLMLIYEILVDFDNRNPSTLFFPGDIRENDAEQDDVLGLIAKIWDVSDTIAAMKTSNTSLSAIAQDAERIMSLGCNFDSKIYDVTDNIIIEKFDAQPTLLSQLLDNIDTAIASLTKFTFVNTEISESLEMQVKQVVAEADKVIKQNPNDYDYTQRRIESSNAEDIIKFDGGLDKLLEYAKSLLMRKEDWHIHLIGTKTKRILETGCKYERNKITVTDDKLICKVVEGDFTAIADKPGDILKKLVDWKIKEYGEEESDKEFIDDDDGGNGGEPGEETFEAIAVPGRPKYSGVVGFAKIGKYNGDNFRFFQFKNQVRATINNSNEDWSRAGYVSRRFLVNNGDSGHEIVVFPLSFKKFRTAIPWSDGSGSNSHEETFIHFDLSSGNPTTDLQHFIGFLNLRLPEKGKFAYIKHRWMNYITHQYRLIQSHPPVGKHFPFYTPSGKPATANTSNQVYAQFPDVNFPGAIFIVPRLVATYQPNQDPLKARYNINKECILAYTSYTDFADNSLKIGIRGFKINSQRTPQRVNDFPYCLMILGSVEPLIEALSYNPAIKPRIRLYSDLYDRPFLSCSHKEDEQLFKVDFGDVGTIVTGDPNNPEHGKYGFTYAQVHLPPDKKNVYPLLRSGNNTGTGMNFSLWDARTGQKLKGRFPISVLSIQHQE